MAQGAPPTLLPVRGTSIIRSADSLEGWRVCRAAFASFAIRRIGLGAAIGFERVRASLEDTVVDALAEILSEHARTDVNRVTPQKQIVDRIRDYLFARVDDPPDIADLCRYVGVSRRTLQDCFQDALGLTPSQYLRMLRLNAVRRELRALAAAGQPVSIGDVAARWGFWHWSRFTENYRLLFGELPSHTVQSVLSASR